MEVLNEEFRKLSERNPGWSSLTTLTNLVMRKKFGLTTIRTGFSSLVEKGDWNGNKRDDVVAFIEDVRLR